MLLVSTDPASNLDEMFGQTLTDTPRPIPGVPGLSAMDIDPEAAAEAYRTCVLAQLAPDVTEMECDLLLSALPSPPDLPGLDRLVDEIAAKGRGLVMVRCCPRHHHAGRTTMGAARGRRMPDGFRLVAAPGGATRARPRSDGARAPASSRRAPSARTRSDRSPASRMVIAMLLFCTAIPTTPTFIIGTDTSTPIEVARGVIAGRNCNWPRAASAATRAIHTVSRPLEFVQPVLFTIVATARPKVSP